MPDGQVHSIAVVGSGTEAWMVAAALAVACGGRSAIHIVLPPADTAVSPKRSDAESTLPPLRAFNKLVGLDEDRLLRSCAGTFKLGTEFVGWREGRSYIQPCGEFGATLGGIAFHQHLTRLHAAAAAVDPELYCLAAAAARAERFARPGIDPSSVESTMSYALHLDARAYCGELRQLAQRHRVVVAQGALRDVAVAGAAIEALILEDGGRVTADLYVDASGSEARLIGQALGVPFEDWSAWLPCSRQVAARCEQPHLGAPLTRAQAADFGWMGHVPLQGSIACHYAYDPAMLDDRAAGEALLAWIDAPAPTALTYNSAPSGRRRAPWQANCVALGSAAGWVEPLESTALHLTQSMIVRLLGLFPSGDGRVERLEYNRLVGNELERARDLAIAHYATAQRLGGEFWRQRAAAGVPDTLAYKMSQYRSRGTLVIYDEEPLPEVAWLALYLGQGIWPQRCAALAEVPDMEAVRAQLTRMRATIDEAVARMPAHAEYVRRQRLQARLDG
ncbi:MAG TPA: tryptophan halogenase family protein [Steroidobacteraceae bacterium]|nr:tryptophan halogenase family protein [Steroidobacteraceae bacterium]